MLPKVTPGSRAPIDALRAHARVLAVLVADRFSEDGERGEIASSVWYMVGLVLLAGIVVALITAKIQGKLAGLN
jgi:hypothetical protein